MAEKKNRLDNLTEWPSPLPWRFEKSGVEELILDAEGNVVHSDTDYYPSGMATPDAKLIVESVNRVPELERALRLAKLAIRAAMRLPGYPGLLDDALTEIERVLPSHDVKACAVELMRDGLPSPRTCAICGLGPCTKTTGP